MAEPVRIQRKRVKGWRMPPGAVYVGRPTKWGNPFCIGQRAMLAVHPSEIAAVPNAMGGATFYVDGKVGIPTMPFPDGPLTAEAMLRYYKGHILERFTKRQIEAELAGKNLACWCPPGAPCHADVLLELANG